MTMPRRLTTGRHLGARIVLWSCLIVAFSSAREIRLSELKVNTRFMNEIEYVPLSEFVHALNGEIWQVNDRFVVQLPPQQDSGYEIVFTQGKSRVLVNGRALNLPVPCRVLEGDVYVPAVFFAEIFPLKLTRMPRVGSLTISHMRDTTYVRIETDTVCYSSAIAVTSTSFRVYLQAECKLKQFVPSGLVRSIQVNPISGTELMIATAQPCYCRTSQLGGALIVKFTPRAQRRISTIIIDPGHGGKDPGAEGRRVKEKDVNLDIAERLSRRLRQAGKTVILTRTRDSYVGLYDRPRTANASRGDIYVSIHCNAALDAPAVSGIETFFLSAARNDWERAVASRENAALDFPVADTNRSSADIVGSILRDLAQNEFLRESEQLAADIQAALSSALRGKNRGVKQADFVVLRNAYMPAALVECGFLSNAAEEKLLGAADYRERIAAALSSGILRFTERIEK